MQLNYRITFKIVILLAGLFIAISLLFALNAGNQASAAGAIYFDPAVNYAAGTVPISVATGDFNADGKTDIAVANNSSNNVSILLGNGNGTFAAAVNYAAGAGPYSVTTGDFNADGKTDLATANASNNVSILLGNGNGTFSSAVNYDVGAGPESVTTGDFNADGITDLATANVGGNVSILLGVGDGTFAAAVNYAAGSGSYSVTTGDFNADGKTDLAVANMMSKNVSILLGNGNGTFAVAVNYAVGSYLRAVTTGDFNADGKTDLATANASNNVSILLGNGDGTFSAAVNYAAGSMPASVTTGDFNADGKIDLAVANNSSDNVSILLGNGDGTFAAAVNYAAGTGPYSVTTGDFNADDKTDLAVANASGNNVSILINTTPAPVDTTAPSISSIAPSGTINTTSADVSAYFSDSGSGINSASASLTWDGTTLTGCTADTSSISCPQTGLPQGSHTIGVSVADTIGNVATSSGTVFIDSLAPRVNSQLPANNTWISTTSATISAYLADGAVRGVWPLEADSGINKAATTVTDNGVSVIGSCTQTDVTPDLTYGNRVYVSCSLTGLSEGNHAIVITAYDNAGNLKVGSTRNLKVDTAAPVISSIVPSGYINTNNADVAVYYSDAGSGINTASVSVYWSGPDTSLTISCTVNAGYASCPQTGLPQGSHVITASVADMAGNVATGTSTVFIDTYAPSASSMYPRNNYTSTPSTITASLRDSSGPGWATNTSSGVNYSAPVVVTLDGSVVTGCAIDTGTGALSCPITGTLAEGTHTTVITLDDNAGNHGTSTRTFVIDTSTGQPSISLGAPAARWGSYADYQARILSLDWTITNSGANSAYSVTMTNTSNTDGVTNSGSATASFGTINAGLSVMKTLKYSVPNGVSSWHTVNTATAKDAMGTLYNYGS